MATNIKKALDNNLLGNFIANDRIKKITSELKTVIKTQYDNQLTNKNYLYLIINNIKDNVTKLYNDTLSKIKSFNNAINIDLKNDFDELIKKYNDLYIYFNYTEKTSIIKDTISYYLDKFKDNLKNYQLNVEIVDNISKINPNNFPNNTIYLVRNSAGGIEFDNFTEYIFDNSGNPIEITSMTININHLLELLDEIGELLNYEVFYKKYDLQCDQLYKNNSFFNGLEFNDEKSINIKYNTNKSFEQNFIINTEYIEHDDGTLNYIKEDIDLDKPIIINNYVYNEDNLIYIRNKLILKAKPKNYTIDSQNLLFNYLTTGNNTYIGINNSFDVTRKIEYDKLHYNLTADNILYDYIQKTFGENKYKPIKSSLKGFSYNENENIIKYTLITTEYTDGQVEELYEEEEEVSLSGFYNKDLDELNLSNSIYHDNSIVIVKEFMDTENDFEIHIDEKYTQLYLQSIHGYLDENNLELYESYDPSFNGTTVDIPYGKLNIDPFYYRPPQKFEVMPDKLSITDFENGILSINQIYHNIADTFLYGSVLEHDDNGILSIKKDNNCFVFYNGLKKVLLDDNKYIYYTDKSSGYLDLHFDTGILYNNIKFKGSEVFGNVILNKYKLNNQDITLKNDRYNTKYIRSNHTYLLRESLELGAGVKIPLPIKEDTVTKKDNSQSLVLYAELNVSKNKNIKIYINDNDTSVDIKPEGYFEYIFNETKKDLIIKSNENLVLYNVRIEDYNGIDQLYLNKIVENNIEDSNNANSTNELIEVNGNIITLNECSYTQRSFEDDLRKYLYHKNLNYQTISGYEINNKKITLTFKDYDISKIILDENDVLDIRNALPYYDDDKESLDISNRKSYISDDEKLDLTSLVDQVNFDKYLISKDNNLIEFKDLTKVNDELLILDEYPYVSKEIGIYTYNVLDLTFKNSTLTLDLSDINDWKNEVSLGEDGTIYVATYDNEQKVDSGYKLNILQPEIQRVTEPDSDETYHITLNGDNRYIDYKINDYKFIGNYPNLLGTKSVIDYNEYYNKSDNIHIVDIPDYFCGRYLDERNKKTLILKNKLAFSVIVFVSYKLKYDDETITEFITLIPNESKILNDLYGYVWYVYKLGEVEYCKQVESDSWKISMSA